MRTCWSAPSTSTPNLSAPYYAGLADETGGAAALGCNHNQPLPWATPDEPWLAALDAALARIGEFAPGAMVVSLGFDAGADDPVGTFRITAPGFAEAARRIAGARLPTLLVQEGGYLSPSLGTYLQSFLRGFEAVA